MQISIRKWMQILMTVFPLFIFSCGGKTDATFNIAGSWSLFRITPPVGDISAAVQKDLFTFTTSDNDVGGSTVPGGTSPQPTESISGIVSGNDVSFTTTSSVTGGIKRSYTGKLSSDGATMSGTWTTIDNTSGNPIAPSGTWSAVVHSAPSFNIAGNWTLDKPVPDAFGQITGFSFTQPTETPNDLTGTLVLTDPPTTITGAVGFLDVIFLWEDSNKVFFTLTGRISNGTSISGTWVSTHTHIDQSTGQSVPDSGTWSATKN